jgi:GT2 family glycosyltransferase
MKATEVTIAIPTYRRGGILVATIRRLLDLPSPAAEIVVADQTERHAANDEALLAAWADRGAIRWFRLPSPSIPHAMNEALLHATAPLVLFLDDDIEPASDLAAAHAACFDDQSIWATVGQILQPGESPVVVSRPPDDLEFRFNHDRPELVTNVMAGNLCVRRDRAVRAGGFDENYIGAAYRFESDFALRLTAAGGRIRFEPRASLRHLQLATGGLRAYGDHRSSASPAHSAGDYYFALTHRRPIAPYALRRIRRNVFTRWHLRHPWAIAPKLIGELRGLARALALQRRGSRLLPARATETPDARRE